MTRKIAIVMIVIFTLVMGVSACSSSPNEPRVVVPTQTAAQAAQLTETPASPVTPEDISPYFLPGLSEIGALPEKGYTIGVVAANTADDAVWQREMEIIAQAYHTHFDVHIETAVCGNSESKQREAVNEMLVQGIDFLIISPAKAGAQSEIGQQCEASGVPYITMNGRIDCAPGENGYVCSIERDEFLAGVLTGLSIAQSVTEKNGEPRGNIGEITADAADEASQMRSRGIRCALSQYSKINVTCSVIGGEDADSQYKAAVNVMKAFRAGELDGVVAMSDDIAIQTLQAALDMDRQDVVGNIWSFGGSKAGLTGVWHGQFAQTMEHTCQSGVLAIEYALQYLEGYGDNIPPIAPAVSRAFCARTAEQKKEIAYIIAAMDERGVQSCFDHIGAYKLFMPDEDALEAIYPQPYYVYRDVASYLNIFTPFSTEAAVYAAK